MGEARRSGSDGTDAARLQTAWQHYWNAAPEPLYCFMFLFPWVVVYEVGALLYRPIARLDDQLVAHSLLTRFLALFGATSFWLPGTVLLMALLGWHVARRRPWRVRAWVLPAMLAESVVLTVPLFVLNRLMLRAGNEISGLAAGALQAIGAGIFEELVFRFCLLGGLLLLLLHVTRASRRAATWSAITFAAAAFAVAHVRPIGSETFDGTVFLGRLVAGAYLGIVFLGRGLGVATGCHAAFNLMLIGATSAAR